MQVHALGIIGRLLHIFFWSVVAWLHFVLWLPWIVIVGPGGQGRLTAFKRHCARVFRVYLQNLGATFIKVGQILSTRPDIVPPYLVAELELLQDKVPPFAYRHVERTILEELGRPIGEAFESFSPTPIASASVAQVHRATLAAGDVVAVKVRRPNIVRQARFDEAIMVFGARVMSLVPTIDVLSPVETAREFCAAVGDQLDFHKEAANNRRFREHFAGDADIRFPALVDPLCTAGVLTMEYVDGVKDVELDSLELDRKRLAEIGVRAILSMVYEHGFVHADLHPGNILFQRDHKVYFIDLGMVGRIDPGRRNGLAAMVLALARGDGRTVARFMYEGSPRKEVTDYASYEADVVRLVSKTHEKSLNELELSLVIGAVFEILRRHRLRADAAFTTINIAMLVVEGLGKKLDPELNLFKRIQPFLFSVLAKAPEAFRLVVTDTTAPPA